MQYPIFPTIDKNTLQKTNICYGIDLGTTTTVTCSVDPNIVDLNNIVEIPIQQVIVKQVSPFENVAINEDKKVSSIIALYNGKPYVGNQLYYLKGHPEFEYKKNLFYHWKLDLGIDQNPMYPHAVSDKLDMPYKVAGSILNYIIKSTISKKGIDQAIITVPASFQINQRKDVLKAAEIADIKINDQMLIDEPNAAFLGFFNRLEKEEKSRWASTVRNNNLLVVDFGGGTLDLSILNVDFKKDLGITISNKAISRFNDLGGQDVDMLLAEEHLYPILIEKFPDVESVDYSVLIKQILPQLAIIGEKLKIGICQKLNIKRVDKKVNNINYSDLLFKQDNCKIKTSFSEYDLGSISISAEEFENYFKKLYFPKEYKFKYIDKVVTSINSSINDIVGKAKLSYHDLQYVLFVGGSSFNPFIESFTNEALPKALTLTTHDPDILIAEGAAVYSYFYFIHNISLITPIVSETIGIITKDDNFFPIINEGESLPATISLPNFRLQTNMNNEIVIPVCIHNIDYSIGEIRCELTGFYDIDSEIKINASMNVDKTLKLEVYINNDFIKEADFDNPFSMGKLSPEIISLNKTLNDYNKSIKNNDLNNEKSNLRSIIWKYSNVDNYKSCLEAAETYISKFDNQDEYVWNMHYIANDRLGRKDAANKSLQKALDLSPEDETLIYNYSVHLAHEKSIQEALDFLLKKINKSNTITYYRSLILKNSLGQDVLEEVQEVVNKHKNKNGYFSDFSKESILPNLYNIIGESYKYDSLKNKRNEIDRSKYLDTDNTPTLEF